MNKLSKITASLILLLISIQAHALDPIYTSLFSSKAIKGYDTVAYFTEGKPVKGNKKIQHKHLDVIWRFSSEKNKALFVADPNKYMPQYGGFCAWAVGEKSSRASSDPKNWKIVDEKLYLNYNNKIQKLWEEDISGFIVKGDKNWPQLLEDG